VPEKMTLEEVNRLERDEFVSRLGYVYESSPWVVERVWGSQPFGSFATDGLDPGAPRPRG
jgi:2-oxo-4-hydroxy-4-carboxy-5-ureidoimidazoline decarboxylase